MSLYGQKRTDLLGDPSDEALVAACALGEPGAIEQLFERYHREVRSFLRRRLDNPADVDDLLQATFVQLLHAASQFESRSAVSVWLFGIAQNLLRRHHRGQAHRQRLEVALADAHPPMFGQLDPAQLEARDVIGRVADALCLLTPETRVVFVLAAVHQVPTRKVASTLGLSEQAVWRRVCDARKLLRRSLNPERTELESRKF